MFKVGDAVRVKKEIEKCFVKDSLKEFLLDEVNRKKVFRVSEITTNYIKIKGSELWFPYVLFSKTKN